MILAARSKQVHTRVRLAGNQPFGIHVSRIDTLLLRKPCLLVSGLIKSGKSFSIWNGADSGGDRGNEVWPICSTGLREMHLGSNPRG
jgi:hypothetical protein